MIPKLYTVAEAAPMLGLSAQGLYRLISARKIPHRRCGGIIRLAETDLEAFFASMLVPAIEKPAATVSPAPGAANELIDFGFGRVEDRYR
jgi:excisionase family DNA binding protein